MHEKNRLASEDRWRRARSLPRVDGDQNSLGSELFDRVIDETPVDDDDDGTELAATTSHNQRQRRSPSSPGVRRDRSSVAGSAQKVTVTDNPTETAHDQSISHVPIPTGVGRQRPRVFSRPLVLIQSHNAEYNPPVEGQLPQAARIEEIRRRYQGW